MKLLKNIDIKPALIPMGYLYVLSALYNVVFLVGSNTFEGIMFFVFEMIMGLISSVGFYWLCLKTWKIDKKIDTNSILKVLSLELLYLFICLGILQPMIGKDNMFMQIVGLLIMVYMIPIQLIYFYGLASGKSSYKELGKFVWNVIKKENRSIINKFCICLLIMIFLDTISSGMLSAAKGFDTCSLSVLVLLYGNPLMSLMVFLFFAAGFKLAIVDCIAYVVMYIILAFCYGLLDINYILFIRRKSCIEDESRSDEVHQEAN
ncbi:hypothetical protein [Floccifex sp.]|uniref:hypothetical protein n=1 Tax=Floccifex sp. TaxID=2815810 RepID=UPI002A760420|nr:hypothetical protein [Floccifex sp.]MDD7282250.1 hypothetical protein [Erysipelotrichaceae bacterium]MDY2958198.1 hypothetical protein [Floccifex sp.]